jgi:agmatine/peptidylarginine deiminase
MEQEKNRNTSRLRFPAEWERQWGVQLTWPHEDTDWEPYLKEITATYIEMAKAITRYEMLLVVAPDIESVRQQLSDAAVDIQKVVFHPCPTDDTWARDHGFITLKRKEEREERREKRGERREATFEEGGVRLLDFQFNGWGDKFEAKKDNAINHRLFPTLSSLLTSHSSLPRYEDHLDFVLEGGSIESDGRGTLFTTSGCLLAPHRNQPLTKAEIEGELKSRLHVERVIWIDYGHIEGDDTDGHIDTLVRIAPNDTLLYIGCDDPSDPHYEDLKMMEHQLMTFRTQEGKSYRLLKLPMPDPIYEIRGERREERGEIKGNKERGERLPATYANFLVINGAVLVPTYGQPDKDEEAIRLIQEAFPDRQMIPIDSRIIIRQHGSIHCCTMQFPEG